MTDTGGQSAIPDVQSWFTGRSVDLVQFRINRRPHAQGRLLTTPLPENFVDHLAQALLFGETIMIGKSGDRRWRLGNRRIDRDGRFIAGLMGWESDELREEDSYDATSARWVSSIEEGSRAVISPFAILANTRTLLVAKHNSYAESTIATVFRTLLNLGEESSQEYSTTSWDIEPILDDVQFEEWLRGMSTLDKLTFVAKLPNPDAEDAFLEVYEHLDGMNAGEMRHTLKCRDSDRGLTTDFSRDRLSLGLLEMAKRGYAAITASAYDSMAKLRRFVQKNRTRRESYSFESGNYEDARDELVEFLLTELQEEDRMTDHE